MMKLISIVIPCYNSEFTIDKVVEDLIFVLKDQLPSWRYEIILVNDNSSDNTWKNIKNIIQNINFVKGISLAKNFGQHNALMCGLNYASGDVVVCMDDDGQTPASEVPKLIFALNEDVDVVYAKYNKKRHSKFKNFGSYMNDKMACCLLGKPKELYLSSFFVMKKYINKEVLKYDKAYPYLAGLILRTTDKIVNIEVIHKKRITGKSNYSFFKLLKLWLNGFTNFSIIPLRVSSILGLFITSFSFILLMYFVCLKLFVSNIKLGWTSLFVLINFFGGIQLISIGLIGEYIGRIFINLNNQPNYVIREKTEDF